MSTKFSSQDENPTGRSRPYHGTWAHQFPSPAASNATSAAPAAKSESTEATFARQSPGKSPEPAHVVWGRQFAASAPGTKSPSTEEIFARQHATKQPSNTTAKRFVRDDGTPIPTHEIFARQFAPKPVASTAVPARTAIPQAFAAARTPAQSFSHLRLLNGVKGCAVASGIVDRIKSLLAARTLDDLAEARGLIEKLPEDHPQGMKLVREAYAVLLELTASPNAA